jgi:hypothetical protein
VRLVARVVVVVVDWQEDGVAVEVALIIIFSRNVEIFMTEKLDCVFYLQGLQGQ